MFPMSGRLPRTTLGGARTQQKSERMGGGLHTSEGLICARRRSGFGRLRIPDCACFFTSVWGRLSCRRHGQNLPASLQERVALGQQTRATLSERLCAKESEANAPAESAAIPEERLGAQEIQTQLTLKIRGLTASKGHWEHGLGSSSYPTSLHSHILSSEYLRNDLWCTWIAAGTPVR